MASASLRLCSLVADQAAGAKPSMCDVPVLALRTQGQARLFSESGHHRALDSSSWNELDKSRCINCAVNGKIMGW